MKRDEALRILSENRERLKGFSVKSLAIFGSVARDEAAESSDIDVLVEFEPDAHVGLFAFVRLQRFLAGILGCRVDLATREALRERMRDRILKEAIYAA
ncbi:MAG TPA: nucleotidyltransferase family protein [Phycisphaerae bacterium]|nr:nucleotidyltransferase family protein [Phycisphaerae bacterium]